MSGFLGNPGPGVPPITTSSLPVPLFAVEKYGAVGNGSTNDTAAINAAYAAAVTAGGGIIVFGHSTYGISGGGIVMNSTTAKVQLLGYGVTLLALANSTTILTLNDTDAQYPSSVVGFVINAQAFTSVTGILIQDNNSGVVRECAIYNCAVGIQFTNATSGDFCESNSVYDTFISACTKGIDFLITGGTNSFNQTALINVGVNNCTTGITCESGANMARSTFANVTVWIYANQTGLKLIAPFFEGVRWQINFECFSSTGSVGVATSGTFSYGAANGTDNSIWFAFADNTVLGTQFTGTEPFVYTNGSVIYSVNSGVGLSFQQPQETAPRLRLYPAAGGTIDFGDATGSYTSLTKSFGSTNLNWPGKFCTTGGLGVGNSASASATGTLSKKMQVFDATGASIGYVPIYTTIT